jgi:hypothetical protein
VARPGKLGANSLVAQSLPVLRGAASISNSDGSRSVQPDEDAVALYQGQFFAKITNQLVRGKAAA